MLQSSGSDGASETGSGVWYKKKARKRERMQVELLWPIAQGSRDVPSCKRQIEMGVWDTGGLFHHRAPAPCSPSSSLSLVLNLGLCLQVHEAWSLRTGLLGVHYPSFHKDLFLSALLYR